MNKTNNSITELVFIIDKSGSMSGLESDTVGGFNSMLKKQKKLSGKAYVSTVLFNHNSTVIHDREDINNVELMKESDYIPSGCTALLDAIGNAIHHISNIHKYARKEDIPSHTLFVITTDGFENSSRIYDADTIKEIIEHKQKKYGWEFIFLGANIDAVSTAQSYGIKPEMSADYCCDEKGTELNFEVISDTVSALRTTNAMPLNWSQRIKKDHKKRG
ncbi:MAG: hypothetical protein ACI4RR_05675, partial [Eubacterium sp.]